MARITKPERPQDRKRGSAAGGGPRRKRVEFEPDAWQALSLLARDRMQSFQELADEAFRDLLIKHGRPVTLKDALRQSARMTAANDSRPARKGRGEA
jgi:hypothetical protein